MYKLTFAVFYSYVNKLKRSAEGKGGGHMKSPMPDGDFRLNEMITEDMVADAYDRKTSCQLRFQQTSVEVRHKIIIRVYVFCSIITIGTHRLKHWKLHIIM